MNVVQRVPMWVKIPWLLVAIQGMLWHQVICLIAHWFICLQADRCRFFYSFFIFYFYFFIVILLLFLCYWEPSFPFFILLSFRPSFASNCQPDLYTFLSIYTFLKSFLLQPCLTGRRLKHGSYIFPCAIILVIYGVYVILSTEGFLFKITKCTA